jgi:voltage-gated potassium channel
MSCDAGLCVAQVSAGVEWLLERSVNPCFAEYADAIYFSITTLTTVGFGDVVPITQGGRFVVACEMVAAITLIPFELSSLSRTLAAAERGGETAADVRAPRRTSTSTECVRCGLDGHDADARFCKRCGMRLDGPVAHEQ